MSTTAAQLSIVIPTLARRDSLDRCLAALARQRDAPAFELLLVTDADVDVDALRARLAAHDELDSRLLLSEVPGASAKRNAGWRAASGKIVLFLDDDVVAPPHLVARHAAAHEQHPQERFGALGLLRWGSSVRVTPFMRWLEDGIQFDFAALRGREETGWWHLYTCNCSLKRAALERVGGFDESGFPFTYEDLDLARRLDDALGGLSLVLLHDAVAEHDHAPTLDDWARRVRDVARSERRYVARYPGSEPWFHDRFAAAARRPAVRGRGARLASVVPRGVPWLGERVWGHASEWFAQQLSAPFLDEWERARDENPGPPPGQR